DRDHSPQELVDRVECCMRIAHSGRGPAWEMCSHGFAQVVHRPGVGTQVKWEVADLAEEDQGDVVDRAHCAARRRRVIRAVVARAASRARSLMAALSSLRMALRLAMASREIWPSSCTDRVRMALCSRNCAAWRGARLEGTPRIASTPAGTSMPGSIGSDAERRGATGGSNPQGRELVWKGLRAVAVMVGRLGGTTYCPQPRPRTRPVTTPDMGMVGFA